MIVIMILVLILYWISEVIYKKNYYYEYNLLFKQIVIKTLVKQYSENLEYYQNKGIPDTIYKLGEFETFNKYHSEDKIVGLLKDRYPINMCEVYTEIIGKNEKDHVNLDTVFRGLFAEVEINQFIPDTIKIRKNHFKILEKKERIEMDSSEFEEIYDIYSKNKIATMQILTADVMQMLIDFREKNKITPELMIKGNKLYIRFETGNIFEVKIFKKILDYGTLLCYYNIIDFTLEITEKIVKNINETDI